MKEYSNNQNAVQKDLPSLHYAFVYRFLPEFLVKNNNIFREKVMAGPEELNDWFVDLWIKLKATRAWSNAELRVPDYHKKGKPFNFSFDEGPNGALLLLVSMPPVYEPPEAVELAIVMYNDDARYDIVRVITLELSTKTGSTSKPEDIVYFIGEMKDGTHCNYGLLGQDDFVERVKKLLTKETDS